MVLSMNGTGDGPESQPLNGDPKIDFQVISQSAAGSALYDCFEDPC
jgi:hypothetical protein